jgi:hypothetical protein
MIHPVQVLAGRVADKEAASTPQLVGQSMDDLVNLE